MFSPDVSWLGWICVARGCSQGLKSKVKFLIRGVLMRLNLTLNFSVSTLGAFVWYHVYAIQSKFYSDWHQPAVHVHVSSQWHASHGFKVIATSSVFQSDVVTHSFRWLVSTSKIITLHVWHFKIEFLSTCFWSQLFHQYIRIVLFLLPIKSKLTVQDT